MNLTPGNRYIFSVADMMHVVDECILLEVSPSKWFCKIQATHFTQWTKVDRIVFVEDLGKVENIRSPDYETANGFLLKDEAYIPINAGPPPRQTATEIVADKTQPSKTATESVKNSNDFVIDMASGERKYRYIFPHTYAKHWSMYDTASAIATFMNCPFNKVTSEPL